MAIEIEDQLAVRGAGPINPARMMADDARGVAGVFAEVAAAFRDATTHPAGTKTPAWRRVWLWPPSEVGWDGTVLAVTALVAMALPIVALAVHALAR